MNILIAKRHFIIIKVEVKIITCKPSIMLRSFRKTLADEGTLRGVRAADNHARVCLLIIAFLLNIAATCVSKSTGIAIPLFLPGKM